MNLEYAHKPNYFFFAQTLIRYVETHIHKHPDQHHAEFEGAQIYDLFRQDFAATTTNLEAILSIADEYWVQTPQGPQNLIQKYQIHADANRLSLEFHPDAVSSLLAGAAIAEPDATLYR